MNLRYSIHFLFLNLILLRNDDLRSFEDFDDSSLTSLICEGNYQIIGYEFFSNNTAVRHAFSKTEDDYYKNSGSYLISDNNIILDIKDDLFQRKIAIKTLELFIGVHSNNALVGKCKKITGSLDDYFKNMRLK